MPSRRSSKPPPPPLAFFIRITPCPGGYDVDTSPSHALIQTTMEEVVRGRFSVRNDGPTTITASAEGSSLAWSDGPIATPLVRRGILQLTTVGAEDLRHANYVVVGYMYDAAVSAILGSMRVRGVKVGVPPAIEIDDGPIPQIRVADRSWWRDVGHVIVARPEGSRIRVRGLPASEPFAAWANERILRTFRRRLAAALATPL